jgi:hypothetical protein
MTRKRGMAWSHSNEEDHNTQTLNKNALYSARFYFSVRASFRVDYPSHYAKLNQTNLSAKLKK